MKTGRAYATFVAWYTFSALLALAVPLNWSFKTHPVVNGVVTVVWGAACGLGYCVAATVGALLLTIVQGIQINATGQGGQRLLPQRRDLNGHQVWHQDENGEVHDYLNTSVLKKGVKHVVWDNKGNVYTASKHDKTDDNVLTVHLGGRLATEQGKKVMKRELKTRSDNSVDDISASWNYSGTFYDQYSEDDANADGQQFYYDMFVGPNHAQLTGPFDCTTLSAPNGDDEKINVALTPQGNGLTTEISPACGA